MNEYFVQIGQFLADKLPTSSAAQTLQGSFANCSQFKLSLIDESFIAKQLRSLKTNKSIGLDKISARLLKDACPAIVPSLTYLLNMSTQSHLFPSIWKCAQVVALFKSGDRSKATNYRPICILPTLSKILERAVHARLCQYLNENNLLTKSQFGFHFKRGTDTALSSFADDILSSMENGHLLELFFLDLSKAFDTVNHKNPS